MARAVFSIRTPDTLTPGDAMTLRRLPEDFHVEELLRDDVTRSFSADRARRPFAVYHLTKTSLTTEGAAAQLARALGLRAGAVTYAGLKDKHARTMQHMTAGPLDPAPAPPPSPTGPGWAARIVGWSKEPASAAWIRRNRFALTVRGLTPDRISRMDSAIESLSLAPPPGAPAARRLLFVNYFGDQRFGSARHGAGFAARHLVRGDFEQALRLLIATPARKDAGARRSFVRTLSHLWGDWNAALAQLPRCPERRAVQALAAGGDDRAAFASLPYFTQQMCMEAYQSHLWNETARRLVTQLTSPPYATSERPFGTLVFPRGPAVGAAARALEIPLLAPTTRPVEPWRRAAAEALHAEGLTYEALVIPGLRRPAFGESWRPLFALAEQFAAHPPQPDDLSPRSLKRRLTFDLPRGAYATVLLRALGE
jgi:tRNA pseudouridine13 synthase